MPEFSPAFLHSLSFVIRPDVEGGYVNDPTDRGGETKYGISDRRDGVIDGKTDVNGDGKPDTRIKDLCRQGCKQESVWIFIQC